MLQVRPVISKVWKRRSNELAFKWGTIGMTSLDDPRPNFRGNMGIDAVTGRMQPQYPRWKTNVKAWISKDLVLMTLLTSRNLSTDVLCVFTGSFCVHVRCLCRHACVVLGRRCGQKHELGVVVVLNASTERGLHWFGLCHEYVLQKIGHVLNGMGWVCCILSLLRAFVCFRNVAIRNFVLK